MGVDFSTLVYAPNYDMWAREIYITPVVSQGSSVGAYKARGIYHSDTIQVVLEDQSIAQDQQTTLDIRLAEFPIPPVQDDLVNIPMDGYTVPAEGDFQIISTWDNGGGEMTLQLRKVTDKTS